VTSLFLSDKPSESAPSPARVEYLALQSEEEISHVVEGKTWIALLIDREVKHEKENC